MKPTVKKWLSFIRLCVIIFVVSVAASFLFYYWFGKEIRLQGKVLEIDFFNTVCGLFTIIGLGIAIFQIAELKSEQEIILATRKELLLPAFRRDYGPILAEILAALTEMASLLDQSDFNDATFKGFLGKLDQIIDKVQKIDHQQVVIQCGTIVDCRKCLNLLEI